MALRAQLFDGTLLEFPDGTDQAVIDRVAQQETLARRPAPPPPAPSTQRTFGEAVTDIGASALTGLGGLAQAPGQLLRLVPGLSGVGEALAKPGEMISEAGEGLKSEGLKAREALRNQALTEAEKNGILAQFGTAIVSTLKDPALISSFFAEQVPLLIGPAGAVKLTQILGRGAVEAAGKGLTGVAAKEAQDLAAQQLGKRATRAAIGTGAAMQGADVSGDAYQAAYQKGIEQGMLPDQARDSALNAARIAGAGAGAASLVTAGALSKIGGSAIERRLAGVPGATRPLSAAGEATSEALEESAGQLFRNIGIRQVDPNQSLTEGIGTAAGLGALGGAFFGGLLGGKPAEPLAPGQRAGETLAQTAARLNREIGLIDQQLNPPTPEKPFATPQELFAVASQPDGLRQLTAYQEQLRQMPDSPERDQNIQLAGEVYAQAVIDAQARKTPEGKEYPHGKELPAEPTPESPYPSANSLIEMVNQISGADQQLKSLDEYASTIRNLPASPARQQHLQEVSALKAQIQADAKGRKLKGPEPFILKASDLSAAGITRADVLHHNLAGKNIVNPEEGEYVVRQLENALNRPNLTQAKFDAINGILENVSRILDDVRGSGFYAQRTVTEPSGAGAGVVSGDVGPSAPKGSTKPKRTGVVPPTAYVGPLVSGEKGQPPSVVPEGEPAPYVEGPEPGLSETDRPIADEIGRLEQEVRKFEAIKKPNLFGLLVGKLDPTDVRDIGTSAGNIERQYRPLVKQGGTFVSEIVNDGALNNFLPYEMRHDAPNFDVQESTEYIKDKLRQRIHISYETEEMLHKLNMSITDLMPLLEAEELENEIQRTLREINLKAQEVADEQRERDQETAVIAAGEPAGGVARTTGPKTQPKRARLTSEPFTIDVEARVISDVIERNLEKLPPKQIAKLETAYQLVAMTDGKFNEDFIEKVKQDIALLEAEGSQAITESIRGVVGPLRARVKPEIKRLSKEPITIDVEARVVEETVGPQVAALPAPDVVTLENHYGVKAGSKEFLQKVKEDVVLFATKGANAVASAIRSIIKTIHAGVLSVSLIFNPININPPEAYAVVPKATPQMVAPDETPTQQFVIDLAKVPDNVQGMSDAAQQAYQTLIPSLNGKIGDKLILIADKPGGRVFVFTADGTLVAQNKALFGVAKGDLYKGNVDVPANRVTPAGLFGLKLVDAAKGGAAKKTAGEYDFGKVFALNDPEAVITIMHSVWLKETDAAQRKAALANQDATDSRYSFGCINVDRDTYKFLLDNYQNQMDGAKLFVVPDNQADVKEFLSGQVAQNVGGAKPGEGPDRLVREAVPKKSLREVAKNIPEAKFKELETRAKQPSVEAKKPEPVEAPETTALKAQKALKAGQLQGILKRILNQYGLKDVELNLEEGMQAEGSYSGQLIKLALDNVDPVRVLRHESVHALKEMGFFTPQQWKVLTDRANKEWIDTYLKNRNLDGRPLEPGQQSRYDAYMDEYNGDTEAVMEEAIADAFGYFTQAKAPPGMIKAILTRLQNLFKAIKQAMNLGGYETAEDVFGAIEKGKLRGAAPVSNAEVKASLRNAGVFYTDRYIKPVVVDNKTEGWDLINPVTLKNGTRLDGFSDVAQTTFKGYEQGRVRITQRVNTVDPEDIVFSKDSNRTAEALKKALLDLRQQKTEEATPVKSSLTLRMPDQTKVKNFIAGIYDKTPVNPFNPRQHAFLYDNAQAMVSFELQPDISRPNAVHIAWISATPNRQGYGSRGLKQLQDLAQEAGLSLTLSPWEKGRVSKAQLAKFYKQAGFEPVTKGSPTLIWKPSEQAGVKASLRTPLSTSRIMGMDDDTARKTLGLNTAKVRGRYNNVRDIAIALNRDTISTYGAMTKRDISAEDEKRIANAIADEVQYQLGTSAKTGSGLGWYSTNYPNAVKRLAKRFPELKDNEHARSVFSAIVAVTSNGEKVTKNIDNATKLYEKFRDGEPMVAMGNRRATALENNLKAIEELVAEHGENFEQFLLKEVTVKDINAALRAQGKRTSSQYLQDTKVPVAAIYFGPKLGAFFANLSGSEGYLTMDLWWTRSINRMRGLLIPKATDPSIRKFREMMGNASATRDEVLEEAVALRDKYEEYNYTSELEHLVKRKEPAKLAPKEAWLNSAKRKAGPAFQQLYFEHQLEKMANTIAKNEFDMIEEAPFTASDRALMYRAARDAQQTLKGRGIDLTLADIQAALWYYEKRLYAKLSGVKANDIGYEEAIIAQADLGSARPSVVFDRRGAGRAESGRAVSGAEQAGKTGAGPEKLSIRAPKTPEFKTFFGQSKIVDKDGEPRVMYHGTARDITEFRPQQAGAIFVSPNPDISAGYAQQSASWMADHADEFLTPEQLKQALKETKAMLKGNEYTSKQIAALEADNSIYKTDEYRESVTKFIPSGPNIIPVFVRAENPFDYADDTVRKLVLQKVNQQRETPFKDSDFLKTNNWIAIEDPVTQQVLRDMGFDSFYVQENGVKNLAVYSPLQIKSAIGNEGGYSLTNPDIRKSLRAKWSDDRINKLVSAYGFNNSGREKDTKAFAAAIRPEDFLSATATKAERQRIAEETKPLDPEMLAQESQELYLEIEPTEEDGVYQIKNHEGRHRMTALMNAGYDTPIPVALQINRRNAETEEEVYLKPQKSRQGNRLVTAPRGIFLSQMVPISQASKAELRDTFGGEADIKFSLRSKNAPATRENVVAAMELAQQQEPYMNCQLCVQMATGVSKLLNLPKVETAQIGDIYTFNERKNMASHYAVDVGNGDVAEVEEWGEEVRVVPLSSVIDEYDQPSAIRRPPDTAYTGTKFSLRTLPPLSQNTTGRIHQTILPRVKPGFVERLQDAFTPRSYSKFRAEFVNRFEVQARNDRAAAEQIRLMGGSEQLADMKAESAALFADLGGGLAAAAYGVHDRRGGIPVYKKQYLVEKDFQHLGIYQTKAAADAAAQRQGAQVYEIGHTVVSNENGEEGLISIFSPLMTYAKPPAGEPDAFALWQFWADVKRASKYILNPNTGKYEEKLFEQDDIDRAAEIEEQFPEFVEIHKKWIKYNNGLVDFMRDTGVISEEGAAEMKDHGDYFPFYRYVGENDVQGPKLFSSISGVRSPKAAKGSEAIVDDFFETVIRNTQSAIQAGIKNVAARRATDQALRLNSVVRVQGVGKGPASYRVLENGKEVYYEADDLMFVESLKALNQTEIPGLGFVAMPAQILRALVTKDPAFMLANMMRDSVSAWQTSGVKMTPIAATLKQFGAALSGTSPELEALQKAGVIGGYDYSRGVETSAKELEAEMRKAAKAKTTFEKLTSPFTSLWGALEKGSSASDAATRMEVYKRVMEETGNEAEALWQSLEVMNFNRKGRSPVIRILTAAVPFMNARIQGLDVLYRTGIRPALTKDTTDAERQRFQTFWKRGMMMMGLAAMYWALTHDDDDYKKQEQETRDNYWLIPSLGVKIPIAFEVGFMFKVVPERIMQYAFGSDTGEDFLRSMGRQLHSTFSVGLPQIINPMIEVGTNYSFFTQRPIIGQGLEQVASKYQVGPNTSRFAATVGGALNISPMKIDHLWQGYLGTMGMYGLNVIDAIADANSDSPKPSRRLEQVPVLRRFLVDPEARGSITGYYDLKHSVDEAVRTVNYLERSQDFEGYRDYMRDNMKMLATRDYISDLEKNMKQFREMKNMIRISGMGADDKRNALTNIGRMEQQLTANIQTLKKYVKE